MRDFSSKSRWSCLLLWGGKAVSQQLVPLSKKGRRVAFQQKICRVIAIALSLSSSHAFAQDPRQLYKNEIQRLSAIPALTEQDLGANVSLYDGGVEFRLVDIDIKGNSALPVRLVRYLRPSPQYHVDVADSGRYEHRPGPRIFGINSWQFEVPYITMTAAKYIGWQNDTQRCNRPNPAAKPPKFSLREVWNGHHIFIPGVGSQLLHADDAYTERFPYPADGNTYRWLTRDFHRLTCLPNTANNYPGEGFLAVSTDGTKYFFNWAYESPAGTLHRKNDQSYAEPNDVSRITQDLIHVTLLATRMEDRFGNWVSFSYTSNNDLNRIESNDGRYIQINPTPSGLSVTSSAGTWTYTKQEADQPGRVVYPDGSYAEWRLPDWGIQYQRPDYYTVGLMTNCRLLGDSYGSPAIRLRHPSGASVLYEFNYLIHGRSGMFRNCQQVADYNYRLDVPNFWEQYSLVKKTVGGAGLQDRVTQYNYETGNSYRSEVNFRQPDGTCNYCRATKTVTVTHPDGAMSKYKYGVMYEIDEGDLLEQQEFATDGMLLRTTKYTYMDYDRMLTQPYPKLLGSSFVEPRIYKPARFLPVVRTEIQQEGESFISTINSFDAFVRPVSVTKSNN
jgi:hypothetical protein